MKISIKNKSWRLSFGFANFLIFNSLTFRAVKNSEKVDTGVDFSTVSPKKMKEIRKCIRRMRRLHPGLYLVDIKDGETSVRVKL